MGRRARPAGQRREARRHERPRRGRQHDGGLRRGPQPAHVAAGDRESASSPTLAARVTGVMRMTPVTLPPA
jgi:hypothetical protein